MGRKKSSKANTGYFGYSSESASSGSRKSSSKARKKRSSSKKVGVILSLIQLILSVALAVYVWYLDLVSVTSLYYIGGCAVLLVLFIVTMVLANKANITPKRVGKVISVIVIVLLLVGGFLLYIVASMLDQVSGDGSDVDVDTPFVVYLSAADTFGTLDAEELTRSDTNILAVVNPSTQTVLMVSTPRDYYIPVIAEDVAENSYDKLTHISLYGNGECYDSSGELTMYDWSYAGNVSWHSGYDAIMDSLSTLYSIDIDDDNYHYAKLNFTGFANLVDEIGGITVDVEIGFSTTTYANYEYDDGTRRTYTYTEGKMEMDGATALTYARERKAFASGDLQRNKNQVAVMKGIAKALISGNTIINSNSIAESISDCLDTDMNLKSLIKLQTAVSSMTGYEGWSILSYSVTGVSSTGLSTYTGNYHSVVMEDEEEISNASNLISMTLNGDDTKTIRQQIKSYNGEDDSE